MSRKQKFGREPAKEGHSVRGIEGVLAKGMYADALYQAKKLVQDAPTVENWALLRKIYLAYAQQLCDRENFGAAHPILTEMESLTGNDAAWWEKIARFRAALGDWPTAQKLLSRVADPEAVKRVMGAVADRAFRQGAQGRSGLLPELRAGYDLITTAFQQYERNEDEQARQTLQAIGMQSPFLEWKLMLRGLMAYSANDDTRALENWQRLDGQRLPAQLIASLRSAIDPAFRAAQPAGVAARLQHQVEGLTGGILSGLRQIQRHLTNEDGLPDALRLAQTVVIELNRAHPHLVPKLANYFYWSIFNGGEPDDLKPYRRAFGPPIDDPDFARLEGMVMDKTGNFGLANKHWQNYENWIAQHPERWPGEQGNRARAVIWQHMGENALNHLEQPEDDEEFPSFLSFLQGRMGPPKQPVPLKPSEQECFRRAWELAPKWEKPATSLFAVLVEKDELDAAEKLSKELLEQFPTEIEVLASVAMLHERQGNPGIARECFKKALQANPLDRRLRAGAAVMAYRHGRELALAGEIEPARTAFREALDQETSGFQSGIRCLWAACEFKWNNPERAQQLLTEARTDPSLRLVIAYRMTVEGTRFKLPKPIVAPFLKEFNDALEGTPPAAEVFPLASAAEAYRSEPTAYRGLITHEKKITALVQKLINDNPTETDLEKFGMTLLRLKSWRLLKVCADQGRQRFPQNPFFPYFVAEHMLSKKNFRDYHVATYVKTTLALLEKTTDDRFRPVREGIERIQQDHPGIGMYLHDRMPFFDF